MWGQRLYLFPVAVFILIPSTFIISYVVAVVYGHVEPGFPYISDTGTHPPESCIFGQLLNISAVLAGITCYIRYRDVQECIRRRPKPLCCLNKAGLVLGVISALGASLVANFQETSVIVVHLIGAFLTFGVGAIYCWLQTFITYKVSVQSYRIAHIRLAACLTMSVFFIVLFVSTPVAMSQYQGNNTRKWKPDDGGFAEHVVSTASEWAMAIAMMFYFLTFVKEFCQFGLRCPTYYQHAEREIIPDSATSHRIGCSDMASLQKEAEPSDINSGNHKQSSGSTDHLNGSVDHGHSNGSVDHRQNNGSLDSSVTV